MSFLLTIQNGLMTQPTSLDDIVDIAAAHEPVTPADVLEHTDADKIDLQQIENLLSHLSLVNTLSNTVLAQFLLESCRFTPATARDSCF